MVPSRFWGYPLMVAEVFGPGKCTARCRMPRAFLAFVLSWVGLPKGLDPKL